MKDIYVRFKDYSNAYIECEDSIFFEMRDYFSFEADGYRFNPKFRYGQWDGRIRLLDNQRNLPIGLTSFVEKFASNMNYSYHIDPIILEKENISREDFNKWIDSKKIYDGDNIITPYDYQKESVYVALNERRKILNLPTSAGKSLIQALISRYYAENYEGKILIIVPTTSLVDQMVNDFVNYRLFPREALLGIRGGTARDSDALIYVSTWQTAVKQSADWLSQFGMMMNDECFDGDTKIKTPVGEVEIKNLKPGDKIYSFDEKTHEIVEDEVVKLHTNLTKSSNEKMLEIEMQCGTIIKVTGNHKFLTNNRGWVRADELTLEDDIIEWK